MAESIVLVGFIFKSSSSYVIRFEDLVLHIYWLADTNDLWIAAILDISTAGSTNVLTFWIRDSS